MVLEVSRTPLTRMMLSGTHSNANSIALLMAYTCKLQTTGKSHRSLSICCSPLGGREAGHHGLGSNSKSAHLDHRPRVLGLQDKE